MVGRARQGAQDARAAGQVAHVGHLSRVQFLADPLTRAMFLVSQLGMRVQVVAELDETRQLIVDEGSKVGGHGWSIERRRSGGRTPERACGSLSSCGAASGRVAHGLR